VCLLTGASGTLGTAFCRRFASAYDIVGVSGRRTPVVPTQGQRIVDPLLPEIDDPSHNGAAIYAVNADLSQPREISRVVELALARFDRIDVLVNAAASSARSPILDGPKFIETLDAALQLNTLAPALLAAQVVESFWRHYPGDNQAFNRNIIHISSTSGVYVHSGDGLAAYSVSKAALDMLACHMAEEYSAIGIRCNAVAPHSFPRAITTDRVLDAIVEVDNGQANGEIVLVEPTPTAGTRSRAPEDFDSGWLEESESSLDGRGSPPSSRSGRAQARQTTRGRSKPKAEQKT